MKRRVLCLVWNVIIALAVFWVWCALLMSADPGGRLTAAGLRNLKYFTVLSNLLQGFVSVAWAVGLALKLRGKIAELPRTLRLLKYAAAVSVLLTFLTVATFLGPLYGYANMFSGVNFWYHLAVPLAAALDYCVLDREGSPTLQESWFALLPMLAYAAGYVLNLLINGIGRWPHTNDWYGFAAGGPAASALIFFVILLGTWLIALAIRLPRRTGKRPRNQ